MKKKIVIVDDDEMYISKLELLLMSREEELIDLEIVTGEYYHQYFSQSRNIDCLIIDEKYYDEIIKKQTIGYIIQLSYIQKEEGYNAKKEEVIYKYSSVKEIFHKIIGKLGLPVDARNVLAGKVANQPQIIMVYSPVGGTGKTSVALTLCSQLGMLNKNVLYLNFDDIQSFQWYLNKEGFIENGLERVLHTKGDNLLGLLQESVWHMEFDILKPFKGTKEAYGLEAEHFDFFLEKLKESMLYDFVIVDGDSSIGKLNSTLMMKSDKIITVLNPTPYLNYATRNFLNNIRISEKEKMLFICNRYNQTMMDEISFSIMEYIPEIENENSSYIENWLKLGIMKETALMLV